MFCELHGASIHFSSFVTMSLLSMMSPQKVFHIERKIFLKYGIKLCYVPYLYIVFNLLTSEPQ